MPYVALEYIFHHQHPNVHGPFETEAEAADLPFSRATEAVIPKELIDLHVPSELERRDPSDS
jgi:hypothetical protein